MRIASGSPDSLRVTVVDAEAPLQEAIELMATEGLHHLPVIKDGKLRGMLSGADVLRALIDAD